MKAMNLIFGGTAVGAVYWDGAEVSAVWLGDKLLWERGGTASAE